MNRRHKRGRTALIGLTVLLQSMTAIAGPPPATLAEQLREMASREKFNLEGIEFIGNDSPVNASGDTAEQLRSLLSDFNYILIQKNSRQIEKLKISSRKNTQPSTAASTNGATVSTTRNGTQHSVEATIIGPNSVAKSVSLIVDTGASILILPSSMIQELGFNPGNLQEGISQTASGTTPVKVGFLRTVKLGSAAAKDVQVGFIEDRKLQGAKLLGMSFLQRYRMTIDDQNNELILTTK